MRRRVALEVALETKDPLEQALGIVEAVDAEDDAMIVAEAAAQALRAFAHSWIFREVLEVLDRDSQRKGANLGGAATEVDFIAIPVDLGAQDALAGAFEMMHVGQGVEADQVAPEHPDQKFAAPRKDAEQFLRRKWHVPEQSDRKLRAARPNHHRRDGE